MFRKSRRKIVASIMAILGSVWIGTLSVIYVTSYFEMSRQNEKMLMAHAQMYDPFAVMNKLPPGRPGGGKHGFEPGLTESPMFQLSIFYTVALTYDGDVIEIRNDSPTVHTDADLIKMAQDIISGDKEKGREDNLAYYRADKNSYMLVVFMDNTVVNENAMTLFRFTLVFGGMALVVFFFLSVFLSRKIVEPLEESYQKQKQFISDAGHELKTPISVVSANAELLAREIGENQWLSNIQYENERMGMLVGQLLDLTRAENVTLQMEHMNFSRLVAGEVLPFEGVAFERGIVLNSKIANDISVEGNRSQLKQIVSILLDNALKHSITPGEVSLALIKEHGYAVLSVINQGDEIPKEQREKIFERFYRIDDVRNSEDKHYGLGLAIAKAIVSAHKGQIKVQCSNGRIEFQVKIPAL
ncbi:MAG: HAMP domain-containing sensor histidine kinase [bacterium]|nr:HAMP domain-containing sensor histidine kinase [bacterium]